MAIVTKLARMDGTLLAYSSATSADCLATPAQSGLQIIEFDEANVSDQMIALQYTPRFIGTAQGWIPADENYPTAPTTPAPAPGSSTAENS